jgi:hypothetical protein
MPGVHLVTKLVLFVLGVAVVANFAWHILMGPKSDGE